MKKEKLLKIPDTKIPPKLLTSAMAAKILGFTADHVRHLIGKGKIKAVKLGHDWIVEPKAIAHIKRLRRSTNKEERRCQK